MDKLQLLDDLVFQVPKKDDNVTRLGIANVIRVMARKADPGRESLLLTWDIFGVWESQTQIAAESKTLPISNPIRKELQT